MADAPAPNWVMFTNAITGDRVMINIAYATHIEESKHDPGTLMVSSYPAPLWGDLDTLYLELQPSAITHSIQAGPSNE
jgi:hypothetical protein